VADKLLLLWGDTQVGKTTLVAAALKGRQRELPMVDFVNSPDVDTVLGYQWSRLQRNLLVMPTKHDKHLDVLLTLRDGGSLEVRDIPGALTAEVHKPEVRELVLRADAILLVAEWQARNLEGQMNAIGISWAILQERLTGLAFTKCERRLDAGDPEWRGEPGWWKSGGFRVKHEQLLEEFGEAVWPTSAYGYDADSRPNCLLGEFGQVIPFNVSPKNVAAPFQWFLKRLFPEFSQC